MARLGFTLLDLNCAKPVLLSATRRSLLNRRQGLILMKGRGQRQRPFQRHRACAPGIGRGSLLSQERISPDRTANPAAETAALAKAASSRVTRYSFIARLAATLRLPDGDPMNI